MTAERTMHSRELQSLRILNEEAGNDLSSKNIVRLLDDFILDGPNGRHQCLVCEMLGPTLNIIVNDAYEEGGNLEVDTVLKLSTQLLEAVSFMHEVGYSHGGVSIDSLVSLRPMRTDLLTTNPVRRPQP